MHYGQLSNLNWFWWVALVLAITIVAIVRHQRARGTFATPELLRQMVPSSGNANFRSLLLSTLALIAIVVGLVDIRWGRVWREVPQRGIEVMFVLDVSRSMLAQDTAPNRLERSKQYIKDMIQEMAGDRVGLVLFAGDVKKHIPLTNHYGDYTASLDEIGPHNIDRGGSNLASAIEVAADSFLEKTSDHRAIVLFTDGEYHESQPVDAAKEALAEHGTRIFTVGIGDSEAGAKIPQKQRRGRGETYLEYGGSTVLSKRNDGVLEEIALTTDGAYIPAGTKHVDMGAVYHRFIANIEQQDFDSARVNIYVPRYHWFLGFALAALVLDILLTTSKRSRSADTRDDVATTTHGHKQARAMSTAAAAVAVLLAFASAKDTDAQAPTTGEGAPSQEQTDAIEQSTEPLVAPEVLVQQGQAALKQGDTAQAIECFAAAEAQGFSDPRLSYNKGIAHYNQGELEQARDAFASSAASADPEIAGRSRYNLGNSFYTAAVQQMEQDPATAMAGLQSAIDHYRGALAANPNDRDARANIELADRLRRQLQEQQEQQPEQQQQDQNQQGQDGESQQQEQNEQQQNEGDQEQESEENSGQQDSESESADNQDGSENQQGEPESKQSSDSNQPQETSTQDEQAETSPQDEGEQEPPDEGELKSINESQEAAAPKGEGKEGPPMTMQEARKLLQAVRDREFRNRLEQLRRMRPRRVAVEKDW